MIFWINFASITTIITRQIYFNIIRSFSECFQIHTKNIRVCDVNKNRRINHETSLFLLSNPIN